MTKGDLANRILKLIGVNTRTSSASSSEIQDTLINLEDWMLANNAVGRRIGWAQAADTSKPDPADDANIPDWSVMGVVNSMAIYIAPYFDKQVHPAIPVNARIGMQTITNRTVEIQPVQYPSRMPRGKAAGPYGLKYYHPADRIVTHQDYLTDEGDDPITTP
jgi:hypothetical protein